MGNSAIKGAPLNSQGWGGGEETRSGTEKRCSHNLQSGLLLIAVFFPLNDLDFLEARSEPAEEIRNAEKYEKHNIMHLCFSCVSYLSFGTEIAGETVLDLNQQQCARSIYIGYIAFAG